MIIEIIIALLLGIASGVFTGLAPGIHINLVGATLLGFVASGKLNFFPPIALVAFIVSMAITHTFIDFIPSIFLGAPEEETYLSVLPGHQLLKEGKGYEAVVLTFYGCLTALPIILLVGVFFVFFLNDVFSAIKFLIPYFLIFISLYLIFREEEFLISLATFILAGFLGLMTFNLPVKEPLLPLLSGLFGVSGLILSIKDKVKIPKQEFKKIKEIKIKKKSLVKSCIASTFFGSFFSFLPAVGSGYGSIFSSEAIGKDGEDKRIFLFLLGLINVMAMSLSFVVAYSIGKTRTGSAVAVQQILEKISLSNLFFIILIIIISSVAAFFLGLSIAKIFAFFVERIDYSKISLAVIGLILIVNFLLSNWIGIIVLITSSALGIFAILSNVRRINLVGCLIIPSIIYSLVA